MPWSETSPMDQKIRFISDYLRGGLAFAELCDHFGISRKTGCKWLDRYLRQGTDALVDRSRRPRSSPNQTPPAVLNALLEIRQKHPSWERRSCWPSLPSDIRAGRCLIALPSAISSNDMAWCLSNGRRAGLAIPANPPPSALRPTISGLQTSKASSRLAMESTATR